jgi:hypothetical protein
VGLPPGLYKFIPGPFGEVYPERSRMDSEPPLPVPRQRYGLHTLRTAISLAVLQDPCIFFLPGCPLSHYASESPIFCSIPDYITRNDALLL